MKKIEILAPGGDIDSIKSAILAGADAVYCGLDRFNARNRAKNISYNELLEILPFAHKNNTKIFLTLNIIILENELPSLIKLLDKLVNTTLDGIIVQDLGLLYILNKYYPSIEVHISTQMTTHNIGQIEFLEKFGINRVNLSRELSLGEIKDITEYAHKRDIAIEVFVHGANCLSFSGLCYISSYDSGNSGNRGRCSQPCRNEYLTTSKGKNFPLNMKDNSALRSIPDLIKIGVDSFKIEGRIKGPHYVYTVVKKWKDEATNYLVHGRYSDDDSEIRSVFNRDFTDGYLHGKITSKMFIDNPRDYSAQFVKSDMNITLENAKAIIYKSRTEIISTLQSTIASMVLGKENVSLYFSGDMGTPLSVVIKMREKESIFHSQSLLQQGTSKNSISREQLLKRFSSIGNKEFTIESFIVEIGDNLSIPFKELTTLRKEIMSYLIGKREQPAIDKLPSLPNGVNCTQPTLSILINRSDDLDISKYIDGDIYFEIPSNIEGKLEQYLSIFDTNSSLIPWFTNLYIGKEFEIATEFLRRLSHRKIVTDNSGIAVEAETLGIKWIAGPHFNTSNSYALLAIDSFSNSIGAFLSNELNRKQLSNIKIPKAFNILYKVFGIIELMVTRQCLIKEIDGCNKEMVDSECVANCNRVSYLENDEKLIINKSSGNYTKVLSDKLLLNSEILKELPNTFSSYLLDFRELEHYSIDFNFKLDITNKLKQSLTRSHRSNISDTQFTNKQYCKGL